MQAHDCDVAVIGGGLAGTSAALAFAQQGCAVRLFERRDLARDPNRGDILHAPTVEIVRRLGILDLLEARGAARWHGLRFVDPGGRFDFSSEIRESWLLNHAEMESAFLDAAESHGAAIQYEVIRSLVRDDDSGGWLLGTDDGTTRARFVVGGDGAESLTRRTLGIALEDVLEYDNWIVVLHSPSPSWLPPDYGFTLPHVDGTVWLLPTTPSPRHRVIISVAREDTKDWMTSSEAELLRRLEERYAPFGELELNKRGGSHVYRVKRTHAQRYWDSRVALVGDAIHTIHPAGGQGLNIAIQDSVKLAELVGPVLGDVAASDDVITEALREYEAARRPVNRTVIDIAHFNAGLAGPGQEPYDASIDFYGKAAADPNFVREWHASFGGRE